MSKKDSKSYIDDNDEVMELDDAWFKEAAIYMGLEPKKAISLRVEPRIIEYYKSFGKGYQKRMQAILNAYALAHPLKKKSRKK